MGGFEGIERRSGGGTCLEHSGHMQKLKDLRADVEESKQDIKKVCGKLDSIKTYIMTLLGGLAVTLALQLLQMFGK